MKPLALSSSISVAGISKLPADVISLILTFLPIKESVRTSILSKQWRHLWRSVPQLVFDEHFAAIHDEHFSAIHDELFPVIHDELFADADAELNESSEVMLIIIYQALLVHEGPINKFELAIPGMKCCPQFDQLINSLSAKSVKELFLRIDSYALLPSSLFSVPDLNSLKLQGFIFEEPIWSVGFSKLTLLELKHVKLHNGFLQNFLPKCPLLEELRVLQCEITEERPVFVTSSVKVLLFHSYPGEIRFEYTSLLSVLSVLPPCDGKYCVYSDLSGPLKLDIVALFDSLPALEQLNLGVEFLLHDEDDYYRRSDDTDGLQELLEESEDQVGVCCLERLEEFNIKNSSGTQVELDLVRLVLATAPELKRVSIKPKRDLSSGTMLRFLADVTLCKRISMEAEVEYALTNIDEGLNTLDLDHQ
ncbi:F-box/FBD/LRR-repeat protein At1g13570 [Linum perenne]